MRTMFIILLISLIGLQYKLWVGDGNILEWRNLQKTLAIHVEENKKSLRINHAMEADIMELQNGEQALEEQARFELGMIKPNEIYYQFSN